MEGMSQSKKYRYQNISGQPQELIGYGIISAGGIIETEEPVDNPNFELKFDSDAKVGVEAPPKKPSKK